MITTTIIRVGVSVGDRVAGYIPNCPEAIIAMAATASLGGPDHLIMIIISVEMIVSILLIFRSRVEFNFAGLWGLWRSRPLLAD